MLRTCRQVSFEAPECNPSESVFCFEIPVPEVPNQGALIKVICAGVCYKRRQSSDVATPPPSPAIKGIRDAALFPGYEVAGVIDQLGPDVPQHLNLRIGERVVVYPYEELPSAGVGYADYISVPDAKYLVKLPDNVPFHVAAVLPSGALWAINAIQSVLNQLGTFVGEDKKPCNVLVVGTGGLALWTIRIAAHYLADKMNQVKITVATLQDDAFGVTEELERFNVVSWNEDVYEKYLIDRTKNACGGLVDIALDFGATFRSLSRILKCIKQKGVILIGSECYEILSKKIKANYDESQAEFKPITLGSLEQLKELITLVSEGKICPPPCNIFPVEDAHDAMRKLSNSTIKGRAVLQFENAD